MEAMTTDTANADIRAVFFDIDGTLTSFTTHTVPDSTIEAIHRLQAAGIKVLICTAARLHRCTWCWIPCR